MVGEIVELTGRKSVDDGLHERPFVPGADDNISLFQISYTTVGGREICAADLCHTIATSI